MVTVLGKTEQGCRWVGLLSQTIVFREREREVGTEIEYKNVTETEE